MAFPCKSIAFFRVMIAMTAFLLAVRPASAQPDHDRRHDPGAAIARLVAGLADETFEGRQAAMKQIWSSPELSVEALRLEARTADAETAARIERLIGFIKLGITPATPPEVARRVYEFHLADVDGKYEALQELMRLEQYTLALDLIESLDDEYSREYLMASLLDVGKSLVQRFVPSPWTELDDERLARLDRISTHPLLWKWNRPDCLIYWSLRGRIPAMIESLEVDGLVESRSESRVQKAELLRFAGRHEAALEEIERLPPAHERRNSLRQQIFRESDRWADLAAELDGQRVATASVKSAPCQAALLHFWSGDDEGRKRAIARLNADDSPAAHDGRALIALCELDLGGLLESSESMSPGAAFRMLCQIEQYDRAFEISGAPAEPAERRSWYSRKLRTMMRKFTLARDHDDDIARSEGDSLFDLLMTFAWHTGELGDIGESRWYFEQLARRLASDEDYESTQRRATAFERVVALKPDNDVWHFLEQFGLLGEIDTALGQICPNTTEEAAAWNEILADSIPDPLERLQLIASLLKSPLGDAERTFDIELLCGIARQYIELQHAAYRPQLMMSVARTCRLHGLAAAAADWLLDAGYAGSGEGFASLADVAAERGDFAAALQWSRRAWEASPDTAHLYKSAIFQRRLGDDEASRGSLRRAALLDLHSWMLPDYATVLKDAGLDDEAETLLERYLGGIDSEHESFTQHARFAELLRSSDPDRSLHHWRLALLSRMNYVEAAVDSLPYTHYLAIETAMAEADVALSTGEPSRAADILLRCIDVNSATTVLVERFVQRLEASGERDLADQLFDTTAARFVRVLEQWPESALHHNNYAWACARCHRLPAERIRHARRAVELEPHNTSYLDTLAEVLFLAGDVEESLRLSRECINRNPFNKHYREQLARFQDGQK